MTKRSQRLKMEIYGYDSDGRPASGVTIPVNTTPPTMVGPGKVGVMQTINPGVWTGTYARASYQWRINGAPIAGATAAGYTPQASDATKTLTCQVIASNPAGTASIISAGAVVVP